MVIRTKSSLVRMLIKRVTNLHLSENFNVFENISGFIKPTCFEILLSRESWGNYFLKVQGSTFHSLRDMTRQKNTITV